MESSGNEFSTRAVHAGRIDDLNAGSVVNPLFLSTTFERGPEGEVAPKGHLYSRLSNPNRSALEKLLADLEGGNEAFAFSSGMAAVEAVFQTVLKPGDHVLLPDDNYHGVVNLLKTHYTRWNVTFTAVDMSDILKLESAIRPETSLIIVETPSNPLLKITDIAAVAKLAHARDIMTACDNTWATPFLTRPLEYGIDIVIHSSTKYFGGHSDVLGGALIIGSDANLGSVIRNYQCAAGAVQAPFDCWLLVRSISTLPLRMERQCQSAQLIAEALEKHSGIEKVFYPGLKHHPGHDIASKQMQKGFGGMLSVLIKGGQPEAMKVASGLKLFRHATSLGGVESLIEHRLSAEGVNAKSPANLLRISVGIEDSQDLIRDLMQAVG
jgi:cystathionine gamma-synthase